MTPKLFFKNLFISSYFYRKMKLKVQTITGVTHEIQVEERWTIKEVKVSNFGVIWFFKN